MTTRLDQFALNEFYHVYNRGTDKRIIFKDNADYERFMELLFLSNSTSPINVRDIRRDYSSVFEFDRDEQLVYIGAYCLMPNHFHILVTPATEQGIQKFMLKLSTGYSMYFNKKYERTGGLFEGRFKSQYVHSDEYLKYLFSYIHLNPFKLIQSDWKINGIRDLQSAKKYLNGYKFSSFSDYRDVREWGEILTKNKFPEYFASKTSIDAELLGWLKYDIQ